ncbi:uncharacterized protein VTP21DRAFT_9134 [Calcarisporiella thermophila]|uniref:uncharacterized protein n=1 Tax=Calcarisporiella thermophila TaxID=911321 RepID=UPI0037446ABE
MSNSVDEIFGIISAASTLSEDGTINLDVLRGQLLPTLKATSTQVFLEISSEGDPLTRLDPVRESLGYLYFLTTRCLEGKPDVNQLLPLVIRFIETCDAKQIQLAPEQFSLFGDILSRFATALGKPVISVNPLIAAINKLAVSPTHLTKLHPILAKECLLSKCYRAALPILDHDISEIEPEQYAINIQDYLLYHYYGGMIYIGLKRFERALEFLSLAISAPANAVSTIQLEAYKKYTLVSLILRGKVEPPPKCISIIVHRTFKSTCTPYVTFSQAFEGSNVKRVQAEYAKIRTSFIQDRNNGLAKQSIQALYRRNIQKLTQTYLTLSLADIAEAVGIEGPNAAKLAEKYILEMIDNNEIHATIDHRHAGGMVSFVDEESSRYLNAETLELLNDKFVAAARLQERVSYMDKAISLNKEYLSKSSQLGSSLVDAAVSMEGSDLMVYDGGFVDEGRF